MPYRSSSRGSSYKSYSSKSYSSKGYHKSKSYSKSKAKTSHKTYTAKPTKKTSNTVVNNHYNNNSATDWIPFMFMASMMNSHDTVVVQGGQAQQSSPVATGFSILTSVLVLAIIGAVAWKIFKPKKKRGYKW